jgi:hypothetical protein
MYHLAWPQAIANKGDSLPWKRLQHNVRHLLVVDKK